MKHCISCKQDKELSEFHKNKNKKDGYNTYCKVCWKSMPSYLEARAKHKARQKTKDYMKSYLQSYNAKEDRKQVRRAQTKEKRLLPHHRIRHQIGNRLYRAVKANYTSSIVEKDIGCTLQHLRQHLESLFTKGMSWDNYGKWHIDHSIPVKSFDLSDPEQVMQCYHFTNLKPMWADLNRSKAAKLLTVV